MKRKQSSTARAIALTYNPEKDAAPKVSAKGTGYLAHKILAIARERNVPIRKDPDLIELLASVDVLEEISPDLYSAVAEILAFIYRLNEKKAGISNSIREGESHAQGNLYGGSWNDAPPDQAGSNS